jgi:CheY-like chemotaxis protein
MMHTEGKRMLNVLVVDDEPISLKMLVTYLEGGGHHVQVATNGLRAWEMLSTLPGAFDVLILDWMMPEMSGIDLMDRLQQHDDLSRIPVIMLTNLTDRDKVIEAIHHGVFDYLIKPAEKDVLLAMVEKAVVERA